MKTVPERGGYGIEMVRYYGSFTTNGTGAPNDIRCARSAAILSVIRVSAGLFTVTFQPYTASGMVLPSKEVYIDVGVSGKSSGVTNAVSAKYVTGSYSQTNRSFQIITMVGTAATDPDSGDRVMFEMLGSQSSAGTD